MKKVLYPISHKFIIQREMENFHGEILECVNCFVPDTPYSRATSSGNLRWDGGVRYGGADWGTHNFDLDMTFAFTPLTNSNDFVTRIGEITYDYTGFPSQENVTDYASTITNWDGHPSSWSHFLANGVNVGWEANCKAAMSRGGTHGLQIQANAPNWTPPPHPLSGMDDFYHPQYRFIHYLQIFQWLKLGHVYDVIDNSSAKQILNYSSHHSASNSGANASMMIKVFTDPYPYGYQWGPNYWPFEFGAIDYWLSNSFYFNNYGTTPRYVFWIYNYSTGLGVNLHNLLDRVEDSGEIPIFHNGVIPHEDTTGIPSCRRWYYRWISNKWKYAPWERYPNL